MSCCALVRLLCLRFLYDVVVRPGPHKDIVIKNSCSNCYYSTSIAGVLNFVNLLFYQNFNFLAACAAAFATALAASAVALAAALAASAAA